MSNPRSFPLSCSAEISVHGGVSHYEVHLELGPQQLACVDGSVGKSPPGAVRTVAAAQPTLALASHWTSRATSPQPPGPPGPPGPPMVAQIWASSLAHVRESDAVDTLTRYDGSVSPLWRHDSAYVTGGSSLSVRLAVHETGRNLDTGRNFGRHVRSLRRARGMTQEVLAERSGLSPDTVRRLEHGSFSPSLDTLRKLCGGLDLMLSTLFESFELGARNEARELMDLLSARSPRELLLATRVLRALFDELDDIAAEAQPPPSTEPEPEPEPEPESDPDSGDTP